MECYGVRSLGHRVIIRDTDDSLMIVIISYDTDKARQKYRRNFFMAIIKDDQFVFHLICFSYDTGYAR